MTFIDPASLQIGLALTALILMGLWSHRGRRRRLAEFLGGPRAVERVSRSNLYRLRLERVLLLGGAGLAIAMASAEPRWIIAPDQEPPTKNVIIALDVSASMQATDVSPTRLARGVEVASDLVAALEAHRVGLLLFAGTGYPLAPPTYDHDAIRFLLGGVTPTIASQYDPGTLMSVGIDESIALLKRPTLVQMETPGPEIIVVIGDGDTGADDEGVTAALERAEEAGVQIHTIGVGTEEGSGMIMPAGTYQVGGPVVDVTGERAIARFGESLLQEVAEEGNGIYVNVDQNRDLRDLQAELVDPSAEFTDNPEEAPPPWTRYDLAYLLGLAALLFVISESLLDFRLPRAPTRTFREQQSA